MRRPQFPSHRCRFHPAIGQKRACAPQKKQEYGTIDSPFVETAARSAGFGVERDLSHRLRRGAAAPTDAIVDAQLWFRKAVRIAFEIFDLLHRQQQFAKTTVRGERRLVFDIVGALVDEQRLDGTTTQTAAKAKV